MSDCGGCRRAVLLPAVCPTVGIVIRADHARCSGWKKRTAIVSAGFVAVCTLVAWHCEKNTVRPMAPPTYPDRFHYKSDA